MKKERNRGSLPSSSSTPRVQSCAELQESQHSEATDNLVCTNQSLSGLRNNNFKIFEFKSPDPKIPPVTMHDIAGTDDSRPIRQFSKIATHHGPFVPASAHIRSQSVPKSTASKSQVRFYENARRFSDPSHVYGKVLSLGSETSTVSSQPVNQSSSSDKLFPEEPHNYAGSADEMSHLSVRTDLPTADKHVEPSPRHIEDNSSMFEFSILYNQWTQISQMRNQVQALRFKLQIKRRELRILQRERSLAEDAYFKQVQMRELNMPFPRAWWSEKSIAELLNDSQKARNEYGSMEDEYIQIENDLDSQEWELSQQENYFYSQLQDPSRFFRRPIEFEYAAKSQEEPEHFEPHPLVDSYLLKLGGLENLRESFDEILDEKLDLEEQLAVRKRFNMTLMPEDQQWLDSSQSQLDDLASKIQVAETEERELRQQCFSLGLIDENGEPIEPSKHGQHSLSTDTDPETLENPRESVQILSLLPPGPSDMEIGIKALDFDHNYSSRNERFDRWSLEKLQVSLLEINIYANCFENFDDLTDLSKLKERVHDDDFVTAWFSDGFTDSAPRSKGFTSIHSTPQHIPRADLSSKVSPSDFVFSKGSPHSESDHSDTAEGE